MNILQKFWAKVKAPPANHPCYCCGGCIGRQESSLREQVWWHFRQSLYTFLSVGALSLLILLMFGMAFTVAGKISSEYPGFSKAILCSPEWAQGVEVGEKITCQDCKK